VAATCAGVRVWSIYVPNGRTLDSPHYTYKLAWLAALRTALAEELAPEGVRLAVCGDFNIAPTDDDVWDPAVFIGSTHVSAEERAALTALLSLGLSDVQPRALKGRSFT
jgi:exodeoxyribonuclease III